MKDPHFERAVVLLCQHDDDGAIGLVINRETPIPMGDVMRGMKLPVPPHADAPIWWGGPVSHRTGFVLWRGQADDDEGWTLGGDVAVSPSADRLLRLLDMGVHFQLCLGYAGWAAAQLDAEIERGSWLFADIDSDIVFDTPLPERYTRALGLLGLTPQTVWMQPVNE